MTTANRATVELLEQQFVLLLDGLHDLVRSVPSDLLYRQPPAITIGENILKSAGLIEQTCGGITSNLWDDPFEWTLPETLSTSALIIDYLSEVEAVRRLAFASFHDDATLLKFVAVPSDNSCRLLELLLQTLTNASEFKGRAVATLKILSDVSAPRFII